MSEENPRLPRYTVALVKEKTINLGDYTQVTNSKLAADAARAILQESGADREHMFLVTVDSKNRVIGINVVSTGSLAASIVHPREAMKMAILQNAAAIIMVHNHPSGDSTPSTEDRQTTARMMEASKILGIRLLDHIILGDPDLGYADYSFADAGALQ